MVVTFPRSPGWAIKHTNMNALSWFWVLAWVQARGGMWKGLYHLLYT